MSRTITYREAINEALAQEMERDSTVIVMGLDNVGGHGSPGVMDAWGGVLGVTKGLYGKFGDRVMDTPISESSYIGAAVDHVGPACLDGARHLFSRFVFARSHNQV
jgi:pyruvate dehydrogenase E1 component beta subunit